MNVENKAKKSEPDDLRLATKVFTGTCLAVKGILFGIFHLLKYYRTFNTCFNFERFFNCFAASSYNECVLTINQV